MFSSGNQRYKLSSHGNTTDGWYYCGTTSSGTTAYSNTYRLTFATDTTTPNVRGNQTYSVGFLTSHGNLTDSWQCNGVNAAGSTIDSVWRNTFDNDTATSILRGSTNVKRSDVGSVHNFERGYVFGSTSLLVRIIYANDTSTATTTGTIPTFQGATGTGNITDGWLRG